MPTRVKICGITRLEDAMLACELGAAALGFNFYPKSPRYIEPGCAVEIVRHLPPFVTAVGVFADETNAEHVAGVARQAGVAAIQLTGPRFPAPEELLIEFAEIKAIRVDDGFNAESLAGLGSSALLLDTHHPNRLGGTGKTFDWELACEAKKYGRIILAGGLTPENVGEAIRQVRPYAVDVASGVESAPGVKDAAKLKAFFAAANEADTEV